MSLSGRRYRRRRKEQIFLDGYFVDHAVDATPTTDRNDETHNVYGKDDPDVDVQHNIGQLTLGLLEKYANNDALDIVTGQDPAASGPKQYKVEQLTAAHVWANVKNQLNTQWIRSWIIENWTPGMPYPAGDPNAKSMLNMSGPGKKPRMFEGAWIKSKKVASGASPTLSPDTPVAVPGETSLYAVAVKALYDSGGVFEQQDVDVSSTVVSVTGAIDIAEVVAAATELTGVTHVMVYYLQTGTGVYPTVTMGKLRA